MLGREMRQDKDGTWRVRCCRPDCGGWRTKLDQWTADSFSTMSALCDACCEAHTAFIRARGGFDDPMSEDALIAAERRQSGISALD